MKFNPDKRSDWLVFILGLGSSLHINVGGYIAISEILAVFFGIVAFFRLHRHLGDAQVKTAANLGVLWLGSALAADLWNGSSLDLMLKGAAKVGLIVLQLVLAYELLRSDLRRIRWYFVGVALSSMISIYFLKPGSITAFEQLHGLVLTNSFEKQWIAVIVFSTVAAWFFAGNIYPRLSAAVVAIIGGLAILGGSRSSGAVLVLASFSVYIVQLSSKIEGNRTEERVSRKMLLISSFLTLTILITFGYRISAYEGWLGDQAYEKYTAQSASQFGVLLAGRSDFLAGLLAIQGSPVIGHGTWALDVQGYRFQAARMINVEYYDMEGGSMGRISGHSNLLEAWVEHGILAVPFWLYLFYFILRCFSAGVYYHFSIVGPLMFLLCGRAWDFFFSPINARTTLAFTFALFILVVLRADRLSRSSTPAGLGNAAPGTLRFGPRRISSNLQTSVRRVAQ